MKKLLMIFLVLLLATACTPKKDTTDTGTQIIQDETQTTSDSNYATAIAPFIANQDQNNLYYKFDQSPEDPAVYDVWIVGSKMKIVLPPYKNFFKNYDTIYFDSEKKTATAYCYNLDNINCRSNKGPIILNYADVVGKTPYMWLKDIPKDAKVIGSEQIDRRDAIAIEYTSTKMWIDTFYKVPVKVESKSGNWNYKIISSGNVQEKEVSLP